MSDSTKPRRIDKHRHVLLSMLSDLVVICCAFLLTVLFKNSSAHASMLASLRAHWPELACVAVTTILLSLAFRQYAVSWRFATPIVWFKQYFVTLFALLLSFAASNLHPYYHHKLLAIDYLIWYIITIMGMTAVRQIGIFIYARVSDVILSHSSKGKSRVMIVGAGYTGSALINAMQRESDQVPVVLIDDDKARHGMRVSNVLIAGGRDMIPKMVDKYHVDEIIIAIPSSELNDAYAITDICRSTGCKVSTVPSLYELASGRANLRQTREIQPQELLGREELLIEGSDVFGYISGQVVLVTGGGGSIGSELCRQIARFNPKQLIVFDIYENNAYELQYELREKYPLLNLLVLIGSVRDKARLEEIFSTHHPKVVFHAAAHKHVPLMEDSPNEAIKNNVFGTYNVARTAEKFHAKRFVLISTDKAVNPTNIMGTSKRVAEMVIQQLSLRQKPNEGTIFAAVRFGNVLGSNGSVIPLFKQQIKNGGPVTVTHPDINRFFMTIPEAAQLVMQAGAYAKGGEIFILDMGEPVKILDLARNLIELSGLRPGIDIQIEFSGLRPGEKMYEELLLDKQKQTSTKHERIYIEKPITDKQALVDELTALHQRIACFCPIYDTMTDWFVHKFHMDVDPE